MSWDEQDADEPGAEWVRSDGHATIRLWQRADGGFVVRFDRLHQAPEGSAYRRERAPDRETAMAIVDRWRREFTASDEWP